jgi:hypothetical protein
MSIYVFLWRLLVSSIVSRQKLMKKKIFPVFRTEIFRILMAAHFVLQIEWVQTFFL